MEALPSSALPHPPFSITAPASGATVSGTAVTVAATASDNVRVAGVQFKLDGANLGAEDTTSPYSVRPDARSYRVSFDKINGALSFTPRFTVIDGVKEIYAALRGT